MLNHKFSLSVIAVTVLVAGFFITREVDFLTDSGLDLNNYRVYAKVLGTNTYAPIGSLDAANCDTIGGWAYDPDTPGIQIGIHIYKDGPAGSGTFVTNTETVGLRSDINTVYGITGNHGFGIFTPASLKDGQRHLIYAHAIDSASGPNPILTNSPIALTCAPPGSTPIIPPPPPAPTADLRINNSRGPVFVDINTSATLSWTSSNATSCFLYVNNVDTGYRDLNRSSLPTGNVTTTNNTYRLDCTGSGGSVSSSVVINLNPVAPTPIIPPPPPSVNHPPIGSLDAANCDPMGGWAYDPDTPGIQIGIHIYKDGPAGSGTFVTTTETVGLRSDINTVYGITGNHGFGIFTPASLKDGQRHLIYADAIDSASGPNPLIANSPKVITCAAPGPNRVNGNSQISAIAGGSSLTISTSDQTAGAITSIIWNGKEFINSYDHGRELQSAEA